MGIAGLVVFLTLLAVSVVAFVRAWRSRRSSALRSVAPEIAAMFVLIILMGVISPGIGGHVGYEAVGFLLFVTFADVYRSSTRLEARAAVKKRARLGGQQMTLAQRPLRSRASA